MDQKYYEECKNQEEAYEPDMDGDDWYVPDESAATEDPCDYRPRNEAGEVIDCNTLEGDEKKACTDEEFWYQECKNSEQQSCEGEIDFSGECDFRMKDEDGKVIDCDTLEGVEQEDCEILVEIYEEC